MQHTTTHRTRLAALALIGLLALAPWGAARAQNTIRHVRAGGTGDGSSWAAATGGLQAAIDAVAAAGGGQVWVAAGTYKPTTTGDRTASFTMKNGVAIYGGFRGDETAPGQRDWVANKTILSGDLNGDDIVTGSGSTLSITNNGENSYHVILNVNISLNQTALLDGFTITGGNADGELLNGYGGGGCNFAGGNSSVCSPSFTNCSFLGNSATFGGAIFNLGGNGDISNPSLTNCSFQNNLASSGGAIFNAGTYYSISSPTLTNCTFQNNSASLGGALFNRTSRGSTSSPTLTNCSFQGNTATSGGGAMVNFNSNGIISPTLTNCTFQGNSASFGGALYNRSQDYSTSSPTLTNCTLTNCSFQGNTATNHGAVMYNLGFQNSTASSTLINSVLWNNGGSNTFVNVSSSSGTANVMVSYSLYEATVTNFTDGGNNLITATLPFASATSLQLSPCSPAIDAGLNSANTMTTDLAGNPRRYNGGMIDLGAYEYQGEPARPVAITTPPPTGATVCAGSAVSVPVDVSGTVEKYEWYRGGQRVEGQTTATLSLGAVTAADAGSYTLKVIGTCNTVETAAYVLTVTPASVGGSVSGSATVCTGSNSTQLTLSNQVGTVQKWQRSTDGGSTWTDLPGTAGSTTYTVHSPTQTTRYRAVVQSGDCEPAFSEAATVTVGQPPVVDAGSCRTIYLGYGDKCATLTATANQPNLSYAWSDGLSGSSVQVCPTATTTYTVTATNAAGCQSSATVSVQVIDVRCGNKNDKVVVCHNGKELCVAPSAVQAHLAHGDKLGSCNALPCGGGQGSRQGIAEELSELPVELAVEAYPNPTEGHLTLRVRTSNSGAGSVEVLDLTGRAVKGQQVELQAGDNALELDVAGQPSGLYLLRVRDAAGRQGAVRLLRK